MQRWVWAATACATVAVMFAVAALQFGYRETWIPAGLWMIAAIVVIAAHTRRTP